jgi:GTP 3',8-cyclase
VKDDKVLRISVTDRCNLRCFYCMPEEGIPLSAHEQFLRNEEIIMIAAAAIRTGVRRLRITGGEPLVRKGVIELAAGLAALKPDDLALTTNGILLEEYAEPLRQSGLNRVSVSLDTLRPERFEKITRRPGLERTLRGLTAAKTAGLVPVKINTVVVRGLNDDEIADFVRFAGRENLEVRFIELMPTSGLRPACKEVGEWQTGLVMSGREIKKIIEAEFGPAVPEETNEGVARVFRLKNGTRVGLITPVSEPFCGDCRRLRLSSIGRLRLCLFEKGGVDLKKEIRENGAGIARLAEIIGETLEKKKDWKRGELGETRSEMYKIGG